MPRFFVKIKGTAKPIEIEAATFEEVHGTGNVEAIFEGAFPDRVAKNSDGKEVGMFRGEDITAWWIEPTMGASVLTDEGRQRAANSLKKIQELQSGDNDA
jgi:hypothetical protein